MFNISYKRVGGIRFFKFGRINISFSVAKQIVSQKAMDDATLLALLYVEQHFETVRHLQAAGRAHAERIGIPYNNPTYA